MKAYVVAACAVVSSACAPWQMQEPNKFVKETIECHYEIPTGSHLKQRVCMTTAQNEEESKRARAALEEAQLRRQADWMLQRGGGRRPEGP